MSESRVRNDNSHHQPAIETLEPRELLANSIVYSAVTQVLTIDGTTTKDSAIVSTVAGKTVATLTHPDGRATTQTLTVSGTVSNIVFQGFAGNDYFDNRTAIPSKADGGAGDDLLYGGSAADLLWAGIGNDYLDGRAGNDQLFGGAGLDTLYGGAGDDALAGGANRDILYGGAGSDRFLTTDTDIIYDSALADVRINFVGVTTNESPFGSTIMATHSSWSDEDILTVDQALANVERRTGNNSLLKMPDGTALTFRRQGYDQNRSSLLLGWNTLDGNVTLLDAAFQDPKWLHRTIYHEIGHNWEDPAVNKFWDTFTNLSGWTYSDISPGAGYMQAAETDPQLWFKKGTAFTRNYGRTDPWEDWAVSVEAYFSQVFTGEMNAGAQLAPAKVNVVNQFLSSKA